MGPGPIEFMDFLHDAGNQDVTSWMEAISTSGRSGGGPGTDIAAGLLATSRLDLQTSHEEDACSAQGDYQFAADGGSNVDTTIKGGYQGSSERNKIDIGRTTRLKDPLRDDSESEPLAGSHPHHPAVDSPPAGKIYPHQTEGLPPTGKTYSSALDTNAPRASVTATVISTDLKINEI